MEWLADNKIFKQSTVSGYYKCLYMLGIEFVMSEAEKDKSSSVHVSDVGDVKGMWQHAPTDMG